MPPPLHDPPLWLAILLAMLAAFLPAILAGLFAWWVTGRFLPKEPVQGNPQA
jgi:hypothetical protein